MAQCKQTAQEFVLDAYAPMVAVLCSHDGELLCKKNNLSFTELVQPFCRLTSEATIRDPNNVPHTVRQLHVSMRDMNMHPPNPALARKMMSDAVTNCQPQPAEGNRASVVSVGDYDLQLSASTQWYEAYRECFFQVAQPSDHEFLRHFLACIFVVSSQHADPMDQFTKLTQQQHMQQHTQPNKLPKWFCPNIFRYYVLLHDVVEGDEAKAESVYQNMKSTYGVTACHFLQINSRSPTATDINDVDALNLPDPWSQFLTRNDMLRSNTEDKDPGGNAGGGGTGEMNAVTGGSGGGGGGGENGEIGGDASQRLQTPPSSTSLQIGDIDTATEATEDVQPQSSIVIDHPLASDGSEITPPSESNKFLRRDSQNNQVTPIIDKAKPVHHGHCLALSDHERLRIFIHEFIVRGLIPWAERTLRTLNDQFTSRKGIHRSIVSATKKWFGGNRPGIPQQIQEKANVVYTSEAPEMQMRRMADLAFMFQLYEIAYQTYHTAKRDFNNDHAWLYYAGALEMACVSVFMQGNNSQRAYPHHYMESAVSTYLNTCKSPQFATRATMLSTDALKSKGMYAEAAVQLIKMTSELADRNAPWHPGYGQSHQIVDSDLRSALLLEQAAHCFIHMKVAMVRKFAFHMILAGHRFSKSGQRKHALRSYSQALQVYKGKSWSLAEDHINFMIGRQSFNLKQLDNAAAAFKHLLTINSNQTSPQQVAFLREYLFVYKQQLAQQTLDGSMQPPDQLLQLPLPSVDGNCTKILLGRPFPMEPDADGRMPATSVTFESAETDMEQWRRLEELIIFEKTGTLPHRFRPSTQCFTNSTQNDSHPQAVVDETVTVEIQLKNPLRIPLVLTDIVLLWKFIPQLEKDATSDGKPPTVISNEISTGKNNIANELVDSDVIDELLLDPNEEKPVHLMVVPHQIGELRIVGLAYNLETTSVTSNTFAAAGSVNVTQSKPSFISGISVRGKLNLDVQGPRLNHTKDEKTGKLYGPDRRLDLLVVPPMPKLEVSLQGFPQSMLAGEVQHITVQFRNTGRFPLRNLNVSSTHPEFFTFGTNVNSQDNSNCYQTIINTSDADSEEFVIKSELVKHVCSLELEDGVLNPGATLTLPMWIRGLDKPAMHTVHFLFYYESTESQKVKHRVLRHSAVINIANSISLKATATRGSCRQSTEGQLDPVAVSLEVENTNTDTTVSEVNLLQISCASCRWHLHHLSTKRHSDIKVNNKESILMTFKAHQSHHSKDHSSQSKDSDVVFTNVTFDQHQIHSAVTPCADFYFRAQAVKDFSEVTIDTSTPAFQSTYKPVNTKLDVFKDINKALDVNMTLIVLWKATVSDTKTSRVITGQHHVALSQLNIPVYSPPLTKALLEKPPVKILKDPEEGEKLQPTPDTTSQLLRYTFSFDGTVKHNFKHSRVCVVPVMINLHNNSDTEVLVEVNPSYHAQQDRSKVDVGSRPPLTLQQPTQYMDAPSHKFSWSGHTKTHLTLPAKESSSVRVHACFSQVGVYNLGSLSILCRPTQLYGQGALELTLQRASATSLVIIESDTS